MQCNRALTHDNKSPARNVSIIRLLLKWSDSVFSVKDLNLVAFGMLILNKEKSKTIEK